MSQDDVFDIIKELDGKATTAQIRKHTREKYPTRSLFSYITNRLKKLQGHKKITFDRCEWAYS